ncbi:MAG TPA: HD domain-containing phosphohydrolase [Burkholderiaceae bacterium]|nr:HD domain-containing phosphohydrolase [Burkholderiaceae bacterium]
MDDLEARLEILEQELRQNIAAPPADLPSFIDDWLRRLRAIPFNVAPKKRVELLSDASAQYYFHGQRVFNAVEPIALAVMLAEQEGDQALLRRALSIQGLVLTGTRNTPDALRSLTRALDIAENTPDKVAVAAAWINISVTFLEATLYNDARVCYDRADIMAQSIDDEALRASLRARALHGSAVTSLYLHEYLQGVDACEEAQQLLLEPRDREHELLRAILEATYAQLLLALNRTSDAAVHAAVAREMAVKSGAARAKISAATVSGLVEVYKGNVDVGISRIVAIRDQSKILTGSYREALLASVTAYEKAGQPDRALSMNRELMMHIRTQHREAIMQQQQQHLQRLGLPDTDTASLRAIEDRDEALKRKLEEAAAKQGEFLEHMALTVELREEDSGEHAFRVAMWAHLLALEHGVDPTEAQLIELAARLHDIGKVVIPDSVIRKRTALSQGERQLIETHAATGADFLIRAKVPYAALAEEIARHHHEAWSGEGYPDGIPGDAIPLPARIVGLCDAFDSLVHHRPWRPAWRVEEALGHLVRESGRQFDPTLVDQFIPLVRRTYAKHPDVDAYLAQSAQQTPLWTMRRSLVERLSRPAPGEQANEQLRQQQLARLKSTNS